MSRDELRRFTADADRAAARRYVDESANLDGDDFDALLNANLREAMEAYGVAAPLRRTLSLRVKGNLRRQGGLATEVTESLLDALAKEVRGAAAKNTTDEELVLELVGVGPGSTVLLFEPAADVVDPENSFSVESDALDDALVRVFELHDLAGAQGDLRQYAPRPELLRGFRVLTDTLREQGLELEMSWENARGGRLATALSKRTLDWVSGLWEQDPHEREFNVAGRVVALSLAGTFALKVAPHRTARRFEVQVPGDESSVMALRLELGQTVHVRLRERVESNKVGVKGPERYEFVRFVSDVETLPEDG